MSACCSIRVIRTSMAFAVLTLPVAALADPITSTGALGALRPTVSVQFNTNDGSFRVDGGAWVGGGRFDSGSPPPVGAGPTIRAYDFTTIDIDAAVTFTAFGDFSLGLLGSGNISVHSNLLLAGQAGGPGGNGFGFFGGGGGGGGGGAGALLLATHSGSVTLTGTLDLRGGSDGARGTGFLPGPSGGGLGGLGGSAGVGGGAGGAGGASVAGGAGGDGGTGVSGGGGGGGGGAGARNGPIGNGGKGGPKGTDGKDGKAALVNSGGDGGDGGDGEGIFADPDGGKGGKGGNATQAGGTTGVKGDNGVPSKKYGTGGGGGGGGGGDDLSGSGTGAAGGPGGTGAGGAGTGGGAGTAGTSGGGGAFIFAASDGVFFSGPGFVGTGVGSIFGDFTLSGTFDRPIIFEGGDPTLVDSINEIHRFSYGAWGSLAPENLWLNGGSGAGGAGGDGQIVPEPSTLALSAIGMIAIGFYSRRWKHRTVVAHSS